MPDQISRQLAEAVYRKAELLAHYYNHSIVLLLIEALEFAKQSVVSGEFSEDQADIALEDFLMAASEKQFIGMMNGQLIDYDVDRQILEARIQQRFPLEEIVIIQVWPLNHDE